MIGGLGHGAVLSLARPVPPNEEANATISAAGASPAGRQSLLWRLARKSRQLVSRDERGPGVEKALTAGHRRFRAAACQLRDRRHPEGGHLARVLGRIGREFTALDVLHALAAPVDRDHNDLVLLT